MKSAAGYRAALVGATLCALAPMVAAESADQARKAVQPAPDTLPAVVVEPRNPAAPHIAVVPPPDPDAPPAVAVIPPDPGQPSTIIVPPPGTNVEIAVAAVGPAPSSYPPCSAAVTDRCVQIYERRRRRR